MRAKLQLYEYNRIGWRQKTIYKIFHSIVLFASKLLLLPVFTFGHAVKLITSADASDTSNTIAAQANPMIVRIFSLFTHASDWFKKKNRRIRTSGSDENVYRTEAYILASKHRP